MKVGDWVKSCSKGFWQIYRVCDQFYDTRYSLEDPKELYDGRLVLVRRIVNDKWKPTFGVEAVHQSLIKPVSRSEQGHLERYLLQNPGVLAEFESYSCPIDSILHLGFGLPRGIAFKRFAEDFKTAFASKLKKGMTSDGILRVIARSKYAQYYCEMPNTATLQFSCRDHEIKDREMIHRDLEVLAF